MKNKQFYIFAIISLLVATLAVSCTKEEGQDNTLYFRQGLYITNEGPFQTGTGTVTFFDYETGTAYQDAFRTVNGTELGNVVQSMTLMDSIAFIVVNNSARIEVVNSETLKHITSISGGLVLPRYVQQVSRNKAYVTDWAGVVNILDLSTLTVTGTIPAGTGPELMLKAGNYVYVLNGGGYSVDSTITVIDATTDQVVKTIQVADRPTGIVEDASGKVWVLCSGKGFNGWPDPSDTKGFLFRINPVDLKIEYTYDFGDSSMHPEKLVINPEHNLLYFLYNNGIYQYNTAIANAAPGRVVSHSNLYALTYDKTHNYLLASDPADFQSNGWVIRFDATAGNAVDSIPAGIVPGCMVVKD